MAYVKLWQVYQNAERTDDYVKNEEKTRKKDEKTRSAEEIMEEVNAYVRNGDKTEEELFVTGINCSTAHTLEEFWTVKRQFDKEDKVLLHHGIQSFAADEVQDAELVHKIGVELARAAFGDRFQVVVTTHLDKAHLHNHFEINSVSFVDGRKYPGNQKSLRQLRKLSDDLCIKYGLSIIANAKVGGKASALYWAEQNGRPTWRDRIRSDIDEVLENAISFDSFCKGMTDKGYLLKNGKHFAVSPPGYEKNGCRAFIRLRSLKDDAYSFESIRERLKANKIRGYGFTPVRGKKNIHKKVGRKRKLPYYLAVYYRYMYRLGLLKRKPKTNYYLAKKGQKEAVKLNQKIRYIHTHQIYEKSDLAMRLLEVKELLAVLNQERRQAYYRLQKEEVPEAQLEIKAEIDLLGKNIRALKAEVRLLETIAVKPYLAPKAEENKKQEDRSTKKEKQEMKTKKEGEDNERRSRSC
ncbi:relaxase/mobilization nuclease domain-containing protein [Ihubacter sp. mB4P-1]|uniref:relaxase/mobilization nuclease domain-containing protein n=1 Tax=Ihubacter sp. mB4P-1 TaxID=3242370 RepID=UPI003C7D7A55